MFTYVYICLYNYIYIYIIVVVVVVLAWITVFIVLWISHHFDRWNLHFLCFLLRKSAVLLLREAAALRRMVLDEFRPDVDYNQY